MKKRIQPETRVYAGDQVTIGFTFDSEWHGAEVNVSFLVRPIKNRNKPKAERSQITFDRETTPNLSLLPFKYVSKSFSIP